VDHNLDRVPFVELESAVEMDILLLEIVQQLKESQVQVITVYHHIHAQVLKENSRSIASQKLRSMSKKRQYFTNQA